MKKILIVEDFDLNIDLLIQLLEEKYVLVVAKDGKQGVKSAATEHPDLILMDMSLPIQDGWSAAREIRANSSTSHIPIIALTAHAMHGDKELALQSGCQDYLAKPIDEDLLFEKIVALLPC